jgi:hypothetical protein
MKTLQLDQSVPGFHILEAYTALGLLKRNFLLKFVFYIGSTEALPQGGLANAFDLMKNKYTRA